MSKFRQQKDYTRKKTATREVKPRILIVSEGTKTEPNYFEAFRISSLDVQIAGTGMNTDSLIQETVRCKQLAIDQGEPFEHVWAVFDRDSFPVANFNRALALAKSNQIEAVYSNEAFEIWYILHFNYRDTAMPREDFETALTTLLGSPYQKNDTGMYGKLKDKQATAIKNARKLFAHHGTGHNPYNDNPCTRVFELVEFLNKHIQD